jgi:ABC-2 type transport system permease protein
MPVFSFLLFGSMYSETDYGGVDFFSQYIPGFCMIVLFASSVFNIGNQIVSDKEKGIYRRILVTPVSIVRFIIVILFKGFTIASIGFFLILAVAKFRFNTNIGLDKITFISAYFLFIIFSLFIGVGIAIISKRINHYSIVMMILFFPMFFLSDATMPLATLPQWAQSAANFNPLYHANIILRFFWSKELKLIHESYIWKSFGFLLLVMVIICTVIAAKWRNLYENL